MEDSVTVHEIAFDGDVAHALGSAAHNLFQWQQPALPEDLCLLRADGSPWLTTISHERDAYLSLTDPELDQLSRRCPDLLGHLRAESTGSG